MREDSKNYTASAKTLALLKGPSRAASVVPLLSLEKLEALSPKRPYSADNAPRSGDLPSCELLKQLLSEPIRSWRNFEDDQLIDATSVVSLVSGCRGDKSAKDCCELVADGLASKPPLPPPLPTTTAIADANKTDTEKIEKSPPPSSKKSEVLLENWLSEEKEIESEILLSERRTDQYLDDLKQSETIKTPQAAAMQKVETWVSEQGEKSGGGGGSGGDYDVLECLDDLIEENSESVGRQSSSSGIVEDNGTYDDIITLLKVLEEQDKKSRI